MPWPETAPRICTEIRRDDRSMVASFCTNGITKTPPPSTTFWPDRSVLSSPVSGLSTAPATDSQWPGRVGSPVTTATDTAYDGMP